MKISKVLIKKITQNKQTWLCFNYYFTLTTVYIFSSFFFIIIYSFFIHSFKYPSIILQGPSIIIWRTHGFTKFSTLILSLLLKARNVRILSLCILYFMNASRDRLSDNWKELFFLLFMIIQSIFWCIYYIHCCGKVETF